MCMLEVMSRYSMVPRNINAIKMNGQDNVCIQYRNNVLGHF